MPQLFDWLGNLPDTATLLTASLGATLTTVWEALPYMLSGSLVTVATVAGAMALGLVFGVPLALAQTYGPRWLRILAGLYVWFFRGTPILVLLFLVYFGLFGSLLGIDMPAIAAAANPNTVPIAITKRVVNFMVVPSGRCARRLFSLTSIR